MIVALVLALLTGALLPVQTGVNVQLRGLLGAPLAAALVFFAVGTVGLAAAVAVARVPVPLGAAWIRSDWPVWTGGLLGAVYIAATVVLAPRLGAATLIAAVVGGQMITALVLDQFGWVGFAQHAITPFRVLGAAMIVAGVVLVQR
jgi:transporter family-2 protein